MMDDVNDTDDDLVVVVVVDDAMTNDIVDTKSDCWYVNLDDRRV